MANVDLSRFSENIRSTLERLGQTSRMLAIQYWHGAELDDGRTEERVQDYLNHGFVKLIEDFHEARQVTERFFVNRRPVLETSSSLHHKEDERGYKLFPVRHGSTSFRSLSGVDYLLGETSCKDRIPYEEQIITINFPNNWMIRAGKKEFYYTPRDDDKIPCRTIYVLSRNGFHCEAETAVVDKGKDVSPENQAIVDFVHQTIADFETAKANLPAPLDGVWNTAHVARSSKYGHKIRTIHLDYL